MPKVRKSKILTYVKCSQCRRDKQRCNPTERKWPEKCERCKQYDFDCSPSYSKFDDPEVPRCQPCKSGKLVCVRNGRWPDTKCDKCLKAGLVCSEDENALQHQEDPNQLSGPSTVTALIETQASPSTVQGDDSIRDTLELLREMDFLQYLCAFRNDIMNLEWEDWFQGGEKFYLSNAWSRRLCRVREWAQAELKRATADIRAAMDSHFEKGNMVEGQLLSSRLYLEQYEEVSGDRFLNVGMENCVKAVNYDLRSGLLFSAMSKQERILNKVLTDTLHVSYIWQPDWIEEMLEKLMDIYKRILLELPRIANRLISELPEVFRGVARPLFDLFCPMHRACAMPQAQIVSRALQYWPESLEYDNLVFETPLHVAVRCNHDAIPAMLIRRGSILIASDERFRLPVMWAYLNGNDVLARALMPPHIGPTEIDGYYGLFSLEDMSGARRAVGLNTFQILVWVGNIKEMKYFMDFGVDINKPGMQDYERSNGFRASSMNALVAATWRRNLEAMELLLKAGADVNGVINFCDHVENRLELRNALDFAVIHRWQPGIRLLLAYGADIGRVLDMMPVWGNAEITAQLLRDRPLETIPPKALPLAISCGYQEVVEDLLSKGLSPRVRNNGVSCLHWAIIRSNREMLTLLLKHPDIDPNVMDSQFRTPLHLAIKLLSQQSDDPTFFIEELLNHGASPLIVAQRNENSIDLARRCGTESPQLKEVYDSIVRLLLTVSKPESQVITTPLVEVVIA